MPKCVYGHDLEVHHINPLGKGGKDDFNNYIVLCKVCHRKSGFHKDRYIRKIDLFVYKFFYEQEIFGLGITSDDYSDEEFFKFLKVFVFGYKGIEIRNKEDEKADEIF